MLTYYADEVKEFHPVVKKCLNNALRNVDLDGEYSIKHHYGEHTDGIPDFVLVETKTDDRIAVIEVKKTPGDTLSPRYGGQAMKYVRSLKDKNWGTDYHLHFCVTNLEFTQFYHYRDGASPMGCVLQGSPHKAGSFSENYDQTLEAFTKRFEEYFLDIKAKTEPEIDGYFAEISLGLNKAFDELDDLLGWADGKLGIATEVDRETAIYELLRISFYYYIQGKYTEMGSNNSAYFVDLETHKDSSMLVKNIDSAFARAMEIDFEDILANNIVDAMFPKGVSENNTIADIFSRFLKIMNKNSKLGISYRSELIDYVSLITGTLYNHEEMRVNGKVMSDEGLANVLSGFAINSADDSVVDPSCGDGSLLLASYNRLEELKKKSTCGWITVPYPSKGKEHNRKLNQLHGFEVDRNLVQLCRFKLICKDLLAVNKKTRTNINLEDCIFVDDKQYDALVMNPPFIRNTTIKKTERGKELVLKYKNHLINSHGSESFIEDVGQPDMYHYHVEKAMDFLNENGTGAIIISKKFMNNKGGIPMKKYLLNHLQAVLSYPNETFFQDEKISTCILILKKKRNPEQPIIFLNVKSTNILSEVNILKQYIDYGKAMDTDELTLNPVPVHSLSADENWNEHFFSPKEIENIKNILFNSKQKTVGELFDLQRGKAADGDAPKITSYPFIVNEIKNDDNVRNIEKHHRVFGLSNSKLPGGEERHLILSNECLSHQMGIRVPKCKNEKDYISEYDKYLATISLSELNNFFSKIAFPYLVSVKKKRHKYLRWQARSVVSPALIIARNLRTKHSFYLNELNEEICLSSNFYGAYPKTSIMPASLIFISAYLNSAFGELSTIMSCTDQDGARKFDRTEQIGKLSFLDPSILLASEIDRVIDLFRAYSNTKDFRIFEGNTKIWRSPPSRIDLDKALSELVFKYHNPVDFDDANDLLAFVLSQCGKITNSRQR